MKNGSHRYDIKRTRPKKFSKHFLNNITFSVYHRKCSQNKIGLSPSMIFDTWKSRTALRMR